MALLEQDRLEGERISDLIKRDRLIYVRTRLSGGIRIITIIDTGGGIDRETRERIMMGENDVTTKAENGGSGWGLPGSISSLRKQGAVFNIKPIQRMNKKGQLEFCGTRIDIYMPPNKTLVDKHAAKNARRAYLAKMIAARTFMDFAQASPHDANRGGIDFDAANLNISVQHQGKDFDLGGNLSQVNPEDVQGISFTIRSITSVRSLATHSFN